ncbi:hypothetical protein OKW30_006359 [Paraburkholderia sp. Clong3]|uniref:chloride channel protein n=1 Tax=Paraburkholderia sp. Clong3 TaxID=2991061 RepID=UPI003D19EEF3
MLNLRHFQPARLRTIRGVDLEHRLAFAGAPTGLSAAFNAPLVNAVFAINELTRSFEARMSGVIITAIVLPGVVSLSLHAQSAGQLQLLRRNRSRQLHARSTCRRGAADQRHLRVGKAFVIVIAMINRDALVIR